MRQIIVMHKMLGTVPNLSKILADMMKKTGQNNLVDLCSGGGGPIPEVASELRSAHGISDLKVTMTDLYPNLPIAKKINAVDDGISYNTESVDATKIGPEMNGIRTMICSFHHMPEDVAKKILKDAFDTKQPICIYEISDNSIPILVSFLALPVNLITGFIVPLFSKPSLGHLLFTYLIPVLPIQKNQLLI